MLSGVILPATLPNLGSFARIVLALLILALFFGTVILHEGAHLLIARLVRVHYGVLNHYPLGALTRRPIRQPDAQRLFWIAAAGPAASIGVWAVVHTIAATAILPSWLAILLDITGALSLYLGLINLLPAYPLDGGRMLRAVLWMAYRWWLSGDFTSATRVARMVGQISACALLLLAAIMLIGGQGWLLPGTLILMSWAILEAGGSTRRRILLAELLRKLSAADVMVAPSRTTGVDHYVGNAAREHR